MRLEAEQEIIGRFWLPEEPEIIYSGILNINKQGESSLQLFGEKTTFKFNSLISDGMLSGSEEDWCVISNLYKLQTKFNIQGLSNNYEPLTLINCVNDGSPELNFLFNNNFNQPCYFKIKVQRVYNGIHVENDTTPLFHKIIFKLDGVTEWRGMRELGSYRYKVSDTEFGSVFLKTDIICKDLSNDLKLEIVDNLESKPSTTIIETKKDNIIVLTSNGNKSFKDLQSIVFRINNFFTFILGQVVSINYVSIFTNNLEGKEIKVYYPPNPFTLKIPNFRTNLDFLINFNIIHNNFEKILNAWLVNYDKYKKYFDLYFTSKYLYERYLIDNFLILANGLEYLYGKKYPEENKILNTNYNRDEVKNEIDNFIKEKYPEDSKNIIPFIKINNKRNINLRDIIELLFKEYESFFIKNRKKETIEYLAKIISKTRNYYTHNSEEIDKEIKSVIANNEEIIRLIKKLEALYELNFLEMLGFNEEDIKTIISKNDKFYTKLEM